MKIILTRILSTVLLLFLIIGTVGCSSQKDGEEQTTPQETEEVLSSINRLREDYNFGTCKTLGGNVSVILFYMDDFESRWRETEIDRFTQNEVMTGLSFLEQEAKKYGVDLHFTVEKAYSSISYNDHVVTNPKEADTYTLDALLHAASQIGYSSTENMIRSFRTQYQTEEIVCLTIFNKEGIGYGINPKRGYDLQFDEHCVIFAREKNLNGIAPAGSQASGVAHEILYLFGAENFYSSSSRESLAQSEYPQDIMLSCAYDISRNTVGDATAFYIGWTDEIPEIFDKEGW